MKSSKLVMLFASALIGGSLYAEGTAAPSPREDAPAKPQRVRFVRPNLNKMLNLTEAEQKTIADAEKGTLETAKKIRAKAEEELKKSVAANFDAKIKIYKDAAARLTDEKAKERAERIIGMMERDKEKMIERQTRMALMPRRAGEAGRFGNRNFGPEGRRPGKRMFGPEGRRPGKRMFGPEGRRPMPPAQEEAAETK